MGKILGSRRTTIAVIITILQIQAPISTKTTALTTVEGESFVFRCNYPSGWRNNPKYLCRADECSNNLIMTDKHDQWDSKERFSIYDNTSGSFFIVRVDKLYSNDSGTYWCGVDVSFRPDFISTIKLNVSQVKVIPAYPMEHETERLHLPLVLTAIMCVAALLFVCLFTLCLLLVVKHRRSVPPQNKENTSDYETMMPQVKTEPKCCCNCSVPDCTKPSALPPPPPQPPPPPPPPDFCPSFLSKRRESALSFELGEYVDVDTLGHISQYQHLDLSQLEGHVYHNLHGNSSLKHEPIKEEIDVNMKV